MTAYAHSPGNQAAAARIATVDVAGVTRQVDLMLIQDEQLAPGDWILTHVGFGLSKITEDDALGHLHALEILGERGTESYDQSRAT